MATTKKRAKRPVKFARRRALNLVDPRVFETASKRSGYYKLMRNAQIEAFRRLSDHTQAALEMASAYAQDVRSAVREGTLAPKNKLKAEAILKKARELDRLVGTVPPVLGGQGSTRARRVKR